MRTRFAPLALLPFTLLLGCEAAGDICHDYEGTAPEVCTPTLCVPGQADLVSPADPALPLLTTKFAYSDVVLVRAFHAQDQYNDDPTVELYFSQDILDDESEASLKANLQRAKVLVPVGNFGVSGNPIGVSNNDVIFDEFSKTGSTVRLTGSYLADNASYTTDPILGCGQVGATCVRGCNYPGESTMVTFDITFEWPD